jgi:hypothetical protein
MKEVACAQALIEAGSETGPGLGVSGRRHARSANVIG